MTEIKVSLSYKGHTEEFTITTDKEMTAELLRKEISAIIKNQKPI